MACRAENPEVPDATLEDGWKVEIHCKRTFGFKLCAKNTRLCLQPPTKFCAIQT